MKRPFSESRHIVSGVCESLKTAAIYKNLILEQIKSQLGNNPFHRNRDSRSSDPVRQSGQAGRAENIS